MKLKATKKQIRENSGLILSIGYCGLQTLLICKQPFAYSCGTYGWSCDYYDINGVIISTGYAPIGVPVKYDIVKKYESMAEKIRSNDNMPYEQRVSGLDKLIHYFIMEAKENPYRDWETDRKSTRLNSSHSAKSRMPSSA